MPCPILDEDSDWLDAGRTLRAVDLKRYQEVLQAARDIVAVYRCSRLGTATPPKGGSSSDGVN